MGQAGGKWPSMKSVKGFLPMTQALAPCTFATATKVPRSKRASPKLAEEIDLPTVTERREKVISYICIHDRDGMWSRIRSDKERERQREREWQFEWKVVILTKDSSSSGA